MVIHRIHNHNLTKIHKFEEFKTKCFPFPRPENALCTH